MSFLKRFKKTEPLKTKKGAEVEAYAEHRYGIARNFISFATGATTDLFQKIGEVREPKFVEIRNEFIYLILHDFNRQIYSTLPEEEGQMVQALIFDALIDALSGFEGFAKRAFDKDTFLIKLNERENEYGTCKELSSKNRPFTSQTAIVPIFSRRLASILEGNFNPEIIVSATEEAVKVVIKSRAM